MKYLTESKITNILEEAVKKPLDYIEFFIYDHGVEAMPLILRVDMYDESQMDDIEEEEDEIPDSVQETSDILLDLKDNYSITNIELKTDYDRSSDDNMNYLRAYVVPVDDETESNVSDDVFDSFIVLAVEQVHNNK